MFDSNLINELEPTKRAQVKTAIIEIWQSGIISKQREQRFAQVIQAAGGGNAEEVGQKVIDHRRFDGLYIELAEMGEQFLKERDDEQE